MEEPVEDLGQGWIRRGKLGGGAHGSVFLYEHLPTRCCYAVKFVPRGELVTEHAEREVLNHAQLNHPNVIRFKEVILTPTSLAVVMEHCSGGDLFQYVLRSAGRRLPENIARYFFQQLISGLAYMHNQGVGHRDLKLENILLDGNPPKLKICDFGYSKSRKWDSAANSRVGTAAYVAPEVITIARDSQYDAMAADVWSAGVILHTLIAGMYPFCDHQFPNNEQLIMKALVGFARGQLPYLPPPEVSPDCKVLLQCMLCLDPNRRCKVVDILQNPWFLQNLPEDFFPPQTHVPAPFVQQGRDEARYLVQQARTLPSAIPMVKPASLASIGVHLTVQDTMSMRHNPQEESDPVLCATTMMGEGLNSNSSFQSLFSSEFPAMVGVMDPPEEGWQRQTT